MSARFALKGYFSKLIFYFIIFAGCDHEPSKEVNHANISDIERQKDISDNFKDNFAFDRLSGIDWKAPSTYGPRCSGFCVSPTSNPIPDFAEIPEIGVTKENYFKASIKGDGSCWLRAALQAVLFQVFLDRATFDYFIKRIKDVQQEYKDVPGFLSRFKANDLIDLLQTLYGLSPELRLEQYNKENIDKLLDYTFRAFLHAKNLKQKSSDPKALHKLLESGSWGDAYSATRDVIWYFFPDQPAFYLSTKFSGVGTLALQVLKWFEDLSSIGFPYLFPKDIRDYQEFLNDNTQSFEEIKQAYLGAKKAAELSPTARLEERSRLNLETIQRAQNLRAIALVHDLRIRSLKDLHSVRAMGALAFSSSTVHVDLMVHKNKARDFGYK